MMNSNSMLKIVRTILCSLCALLTGASMGAGETWISYDPPPEIARGKHLVFLAGDEEYRSEEALPMLAQILSQRHGFKCTVLFSVDPDGTINPNNQASLSNPEALDSADAIVMALRFRKWPDEAMKHFIAAFERNIPIIGLRTSTHAFQFPRNSTYREYTDFGKRVLGEEWVNHWGRHKAEATLGVIEPGAADHPILRGVGEIFGDTDVYEAYPPEDATVLVRGKVLAGMNRNDPPASYRKKRAKDGQVQDVNDPMMPIAWTRLHKEREGRENKVFCTTMGSATDLQSEGLRRMVVNAVFWGLGLEVPQKADVRYVTEYRPTMYGFNGFRKGLRASDFAMPAAAASDRSSTSAAPKSDVLPLELNQGDHIAILGNALADRMQHSGYFETLVHAYYPEHNLVFRNLAAAGDEVHTWFRSENFGSRDEWLTKVKADVILAFYGFNESVRGEAGLPKFKSDLDAFLKETKAKNYSGRGAPRIVLFSPIAQERHQDPSFPDPAEQNRNIALYTAAMAEVAAANNVRFVNLFDPSRRLYEEHARQGKSLTVNGHYLTEEGDRLLAPVLFEGTFGRSPLSGDFEQLRLAVNEKNRQWHQRYRTIDGYNVYGGRSALAYRPDEARFITDRTPPEPYVSNYHVMQQEMSQRDVLTANRDKLVWATAQGKDYVVDDSNLPPVDPVKSNKPGPNPDESHVFLTGEEAMKKMTLHPGMKINLFADEKQFPELINPVQMAWDTRGRLWVAVWPNYPERTPTSKKGDSLVVFEDTDRDGKADRMTTFVDDLNAPTGFQFYKDGVLLMQAPDLWFLRDTDGDGKADYRERVLMGMDSADSHHTANAICLDPGGAIYLSDGVFHRTQVETFDGVTRNVDAAIYRFEPRTGRFQTYIAYGFANPHGRVFDRWGNDLVTDATGNNTYFGPAFSGYLDFEKGKHPGMKQFWERPSRPCPGTGILTSRHFPEEFQGNFLNLNVISFLGIFRVKVEEDGSGLKGETLEHLIQSEDPNFRPVAVSVGPEGAIYFADWHNPIIGHMQHHLRDPSRDHQHGRIYRITYEGRPLLEPPQIDGAPIPALLELLKEPENQTRELAKIELGERDTDEVIAAVNAWIKTLDRNDPEYEHHMMEALWVHQWHNRVDQDLLRRMLNSPDHRARAAAGRVLCYWRDRVPDSLALFRKLAEDEHPRVRLEAVRAASFYRTHLAADMALLALRHPMDYYLEYALGETLRQLDGYWRKALAEGQPIAAGNPEGLRYLLGRLSAAELEALPRTPDVLVEILTRTGVADASRMLALTDLAKVRSSSQVRELIDVIEQVRRENNSVVPSLARLLTMIPLTDLQASRDQLASLALSSPNSSVRQAAWAAVALADNSFDKVREASAKAPASLVDLVSGIPLILDPDLRNQAHELVRGLLLNPARRSGRGSPDEGALRRAAIGALVSMPAAHETTFKTLAELIAKRQQVPAAAQGIRLLPRKVWDGEAAASTAAALLAWAREVPENERTSPDYVGVIQVADDLAGTLPADRAAAIRQELRGLRVPVFVVRTVLEQMRFDTTRIVVPAGKPFEIMVLNGDFMPHNFVVVRPGARERVGAIVERMKPDQLDSRGRAYVPNTRDILFATRLLESGQSETLKGTAPNREGVYEFVCTFPGHWQVMWGQFVVTEDVDAYLAEHPEAPAPQPSAAQDHQHQSSFE